MRSDVSGRDSREAHHRWYRWPTEHPPTSSKQDVKDGASKLGVSARVVHDRIGSGRAITVAVDVLKIICKVRTAGPRSRLVSGGGAGGTNEQPAFQVAFPMFKWVLAVRMSARPRACSLREQGRTGATETRPEPIAGVASGMLWRRADVRRLFATARSTGCHRRIDRLVRPPASIPTAAT